MKRLMWISVALLVMVAILGYGMYSMKNIQEVNQRRREEEKGKDLTVKIIATTETTSVWDKIRPTETETSDTTDTTEQTDAAMTQENPDQPITVSPDAPTDDAPAKDNIPDASEMPEETATDPIVFFAD